MNEIGPKAEVVEELPKSKVDDFVKKERIQYEVEAPRDIVFQDPPSVNKQIQ